MNQRRIELMGCRSLPWLLASALLLACVKRAPPAPEPPLADTAPAVTCVQNPFMLGCPPLVRPPPAVTPSPCADSGQLLNFDGIYAAVRADLAQADADDALFYRYLTLANRFDAGICDEQLDVDRQAMAKLVNMLSLRAVLTAPEPIDARRLIYRIDLRDYDFDRAIAVDGLSFYDAWEALLASDPYAVPFVGDDALAAQLASGTEVPVLLADSALATAAVGNLYYALIDIDVSQSADDFIANSLGIDQAQNLLDENSIRAVSTRSGVSAADLLVQRDDIQVRAGMLWQQFVFPRTPSSGTIDAAIFQDPLAMQAGQRALIYSQPNGMLAFAVVGADGAFLEQDENLFDVRPGGAVNPISCSSCHAAGIFPVNDEARPLLLANARMLGLNRDEVEQLVNVYLTPDEFTRLATDDSQGFYLRALQILNLPLYGPDPVGAVYERFEADVALADVAGDLGVTPAELQRNLDLLRPALHGLRNGSLGRNDYAQFYVDSLCTVSVVLENQPASALCDAAASASNLLAVPTVVVH